jgi:hypothetical protein
MTKLIFFYNNRSVQANLEVSLHWPGWVNGGYSKHRTNSSGEIDIDDNLGNRSSAKVEKAFIQDPRGGGRLSVTLGSLTVNKGQTQIIHLDNHMR